MSYSKRSRYSHSPSPYKSYNRSMSRSISPSRTTSRSRSPSSDVENPGNNLYVTGLSPRITKRELEKHFSSEGMVIDVHLVVDPWTRESRGFGFVTMSSVDEANRCIKYLDRSVLEGRVIRVEKARRRRGRTPTPGRYLGLRTIHVRRRGRSHSRSSTPRRSPSYSSYRRSLSRSSSYLSVRSRSRSYSPYYSRRRSCSPYGGTSSYYYSRYSSYDRRRSSSRSRSPYRRSPVRLRRREQSYSPYDSSYDSYIDHYHRRYRHRGRSSRRSYSRSPTPASRRSRRRYSLSHSPSPRRSISPRRESRRSSRSKDEYCKDSSSSYYSRTSVVSASERSISSSSRSSTPSSRCS